MLKKLLKDFFRDIGRAIAAWLTTTENGRAFKARFTQAYLEASAKAQARIREQSGKY